MTLAIPAAIAGPRFQPNSDCIYDGTANGTNIPVPTARKNVIKGFLDIANGGILGREGERESESVSQ